MKVRGWKVLALLPTAALFTVCGGAAAEETWAVRDGVTVFHLNQEIIRNAGLDVRSVQVTGEIPDDQSLNIEGPYLPFAIGAGSDFTLRVDEGRLVAGSMSGSLLHLGGFSLSSDLGGLHDFTLRMEGGTIRLLSADGGEPMAFGTYYATWRPEANELVLGGFDLTLSHDAARALGRTDLGDRSLGSFEIHGKAVLIGQDDVHRQTITPNYTLGALDVSLGLLSSLQSAGRIGTYPNGTEGLTMSTTSCNLGTVDVPWRAAMEVDHPSIAMALYREMNGRFEQVGISDMKHGFFALSNNDCTPCQHPSDGTFLGVGCSDTYGPGNNADRQWLAPRSEWDPTKAIWTCLGSHFAGGQPDCVRRHGGSGHDNVEHRLRVSDADLGNAGAIYYYEAYYLVKNDSNKANNIGSRKATFQWIGNQWTITTPSAGNSLTEGPALTRWGGQDTWVTIPGPNGQILMSVKTQDLGTGMWRYNYAAFNFDSGRSVRSFSVPVGENVENISYHDADGASANDWPVTVADGRITWACEDYTTNPNAHYLEFGQLFNFSFDTNVEPIAGDAHYDVFKPGAGGNEVLAATMIPNAPTVSVGNDPRSSFVRLAQNRPNPLNPTTTIHFELAHASRVNLAVYDAAGRSVTTLASGDFGAGSHDLTWDGRGADGTRVASGQYYYRLEAGDFVGVRSMLILK